MSQVLGHAATPLGLTAKMFDDFTDGDVDLQISSRTIPSEASCFRAITPDPQRGSIRRLYSYLSVADKNEFAHVKVGGGVLTHTNSTYTNSTVQVAYGLDHANNIPTLSLDTSAWKALQFNFKSNNKQVSIYIMFIVEGFASASCYISPNRPPNATTPSIVTIDKTRAPAGFPWNRVDSIVFIFQQDNSGDLGSDFVLDSIESLS